MQTRTKFTVEHRKDIADRIENIKDKQVYRNIYNILRKDPIHEKSRSAPFLFNLSNLHDRTLEKVNTYLLSLTEENVDEDEFNPDVHLPASLTYESKRMYKLNNYEKNILKQRNIKHIEAKNHKNIDSKNAL